MAVRPDPAATFRPPAPGTGFLNGRRGPRTGVLLLTTGAIGTALAALLLASGVLTPVDPRRPAGLPAPSPGSSSPVPSRTPEPPAKTPPAPDVPSPDASGAAATSAAPAPEASGSPSGPSRPGEPGVLRPGDSGPEVSRLQERLRGIPHIYPGGAVDGRYGGELARAVARFQEWYGVRGDEEGVYGDDTRRRLEEVLRRTAPGGSPSPAPGHG
ncbi:hypothetical protein GCM10010420_35090 [Streptomyces glaucosporus]|uniref:Peptidoglycan binding-like domain-containing protein n=1 Tax=Streptomyces glaucosporus TaxID=284044 RepID=A0ABN3IGT3_9ACTN